MKPNGWEVTLTFLWIVEAKIISWNLEWLWSPSIWKYISWIGDGFLIFIVTLMLEFCMELELSMWNLKNLYPCVLEIEKCLEVD